MPGADSSIYNMIRPQAMVKLEDPDEIQVKRLTLQNLMQQGEVGKLGLEQTRRGMAREDAFTRLFSGGRKPTTEEMYAVDPTRAAAAEKARLDGRKTTAETGKIEGEALERSLKIHYDMLKDVNDPQTAARWVLAGFNDPVLSPIMQRKGSPEEVARRIPMDPKGFQDWKMQNGLGLEKFAADVREAQKNAETGRHNLATEGNTVRGQNMTAGTAAAGHAVTRRGQDLTNQRALETATQGGRTYDAERGVVVNTRDNTAAPVTVGGAPLPAKLPESSKKELASIDAQANTIMAAIEGVKKTPSAFGFARGAATMAGAVPESIAGRGDSKDEREARSFVFNVVSKVINERAGAAQSAQELARLRSFLPAELDNAEQIENKLTGFEKYLGEQRKAYAVAPATGAAKPAGATGGWKVTPVPNG